MFDYQRHLISSKSLIQDALKKLNELAPYSVLFLVDQNSKLLGSLTDGDVRRALIQGKSLSHDINDICNKTPKFLQEFNYTTQDVKEFRDNGLKVIPIINLEGQITGVVNLDKQRSIIPVDAIIMAGGRGERLKPLTNDTPKPLLMVGKKPIIDYNFERLVSYGVANFYLTLRYLAPKIKRHFDQKKLDGINLQYIEEQEPLGTIGAVSAINNFRNDHIIVTNSDILTEIDYESFYLNHLKMAADVSVASIPYTVKIPYAVLESHGHEVKSFVEKPSYTYYSNGGIYIFRRSILDKIPKQKAFNATDLMEEVLKDGGKIISFPLKEYWLDIGKHDDYIRAQEDIKGLDL